MVNDFLKELAKAAGIKGLLILLSGGATSYIAYETVRAPVQNSIEVDETDLQTNVSKKDISRDIASNEKMPSVASTSNRHLSVNVNPYDKEKFYANEVSKVGDSKAKTEDSQPTIPLNLSNNNNYLMPNIGSSDLSINQSSSRTSGTSSSVSSNNNPQSAVSVIGSNVNDNSSTDRSMPIADSDISKSPGGNSSNDKLLNNKCTPSILGGSFGNPIAVSITCELTSNVKYCLSDTGVCCDPDAMGKVYTSSIVIGPKNANYCLSFVAENSTTGQSEVSEFNYQINSTYPNISVTYDKTYYQSTELDAITIAHSTDFGSNNFFLHQLNLKSHNPGISGLNYDCDQIMTHYSDLSTPNVMEVLLDFSLAGLSPSSQVEIPLALDQMNYGENYITTFVVNNNFVAPIRSCATTLVYLEDFEYFQADASHGEIGSNSFREFEGGFLAYGFFESSSTLYREPAGESVATTPDESLQSGMFSMFY